MSHAFDGQWTRAIISGLTLTFTSSGRSVPIEILTETTFSMNLHGEKHTATLQEDGKLHWDDDDIWERKAEQTIRILTKKLEEATTVVPNRYDFGMGWGSCAFCKGMCMKRGCKDTERIICSTCWADYHYGSIMDDATTVAGKQFSPEFDFEVNSDDYDVLLGPKNSTAYLPGRHYFGIGFGTCALCQASWVAKRGCRETEKVICSKCWPDYVNGKVIADKACERDQNNAVGAVAVEKPHETSLSSVETVPCAEGFEDATVETLESEPSAALLDERDRLLQHEVEVWKQRARAAQLEQQLATCQADASAAIKEVQEDVHKRGVEAERLSNMVITLNAKISALEQDSVLKGKEIEELSIMVSALNEQISVMQRESAFREGEIMKLGEVLDASEQGRLRVQSELEAKVAENNTLIDLALRLEGDLAASRGVAIEPLGDTEQEGSPDKEEHHSPVIAEVMKDKERLEQEKQELSSHVAVLEGMQECIPLSDYQAVLQDQHALVKEVEALKETRIASNKDPVVQTKKPINVAPPKCIGSISLPLESAVSKSTLGSFGSSKELGSSIKTAGHMGTVKMCQVSSDSSKGRSSSFKAVAITPTAGGSLTGSRRYLAPAAKMWQPDSQLRSFPKKASPQTQSTSAVFRRATSPPACRTMITPRTAGFK